MDRRLTPLPLHHSPPLPPSLYLSQYLSHTHMNERKDEQTFKSGRSFEEGLNTFLIEENHPGSFFPIVSAKYVDQNYVTYRQQFIILAILLPSLGICFRHGCCSVEFFICLLLIMLDMFRG